MGLGVEAVASPGWMQEAVLRRHFPELLAAATSLVVGWLVRLQIQAPRPRNVSIFGDGVFKEAIEVKGGHRVEF